MTTIDDVSTNDMNFKHLDTTKDIVITPKDEFGNLVQLNASHTWTAKVSDETNYVGDYQVTLESTSIVVNSSDFTNLPAGHYHLEVWEEWTDSNGKKQCSIYPSPQRTIDFTIYHNVSDLAEKEIKTIGFQDVVDQAVMNVGMNYVFKVNTIEPDQTATVVQAAADGKNYVTFNIPRGAKGDPGTPGKDGLTPSIDSKTKHWMIGNTDTGIVAEGQPGKDADPSKYVSVDQFTTLRQTVSDNSTQLQTLQGTSTQASTQLEMMTSRKNLIIDPELNDESNFWTPRNGMTAKRDKMKYNGHNVLHLSNHDVTIKTAFAVSGKMPVTPGQTLSFFNEAYFTPTTDGSNVSVQIAFYTKDSAGQDENFKLETKNFTDLNSWQAFSFNNVTVPTTAAYARIKYVINGAGDLYIAVPLLVCNDHAPLFDVDDLAKANPQSVAIDSPYYSTGRGYTWFHFDKITVDLYSDTQVLTWADYMNGTASRSDDSYVEGVWDVDWVGPAYSDHSKRLVYSIVTNRVTVTAKKSPYLLTLLGYDDTHGYYGLLKDQYEASLDKQRQGTFKHLDGLTDDMVDKLDSKMDELYPLVNNDKFVFGLMADNHQTGLEVNNYRPNYTGMAYERVRQALDPDANFNLGDSVLSSGDNLIALRRAFEYTPAKDWIYCEGNHDRWVHDPILPPAQYYNVVNRVHRNDSRFHYGDGDQGAYYYVDYADKKLRVIVLDDYDVGDKHDKDYNDKAGIRQAQFDWLANTALQVDEGWYVLVLVHQSPYPDMPENNRVANSDQLVQLFNAFETGVNTTITARDSVFEDGTFDVSLTTNFKRPGKIIAVLSGHNHVDSAQVHNGVNYITTSCGYIDVLLYHGQGGQPAKYGQRDQHTYSAICFDFGVINFKEQTLRLKRFGFGTDRTFTW